jgi:O-antigen/teichoic acid export membrane protein
MTVLDNDHVSNARASKIVRGIGSIAAQNLGTSALSFIFLSTLLRLLPTAQYGVYSAVIIIVGLAGSVSTFGLGQAMTRYLALLRELDERRSWTTARRILYISAVLSVVTTLIYSAITPVLSIYFTKTTASEPIFLLGGVYLLLSSPSIVCQAMIQGLKKYVLLAKILFVSRTIMVVFAIGSLFLYDSVSIAITAWIIYTAIIIAWVLFLTGRNLKNNSDSGINYREIFGYTFPLGIANVVAVLSTSADQIVVGGYLNPFSLGIYNASVTISLVIATLFIVPLITALFPEAASINNGSDDIPSALRLSLRFAMLIVLPASLLAAALSTQLLSLISGGGSYILGASSLAIITGFYVFIGIQTFILTIFQAIGKSRYVLLVGVIDVVIDLGVSITLVPMLGIIGAAVAKALVGIIGATVCFYLARSYMRKLDKLSFYLKSLAGAIPAFIIVFLLSNYLSSRLLTLLPYSILYGLIFVLCLRYFKLLNKEDLMFFSHLLPKSLHSYLYHIFGVIED